MVKVLLRPAWRQPTPQLLAICIQMKVTGAAGSAVPLRLSCSASSPDSGPIPSRSSALREYINTTAYQLHMLHRPAINRGNTSTNAPSKKRPVRNCAQIYLYYIGSIPFFENNGVRACYIITDDIYHTWFCTLCHKVVSFYIKKTTSSL